jgi:hypothetical protein
MIIRHIKYWLISFCLLTCLVSHSQEEKEPQNFNLGFEQLTTGAALPESWVKWGTGYFLAVDSLEKHSGSYSMRIETKGEKVANTFGSIAYKIPWVYEGKEIELRGFMKMEEVGNGFAGLIMRIDGSSGTLAMDNMMQRQLQGTSDWTMYSIKLPIPEEAKSIFVGALMTGTGSIWVDDFQVLVDGIDIGEARLAKIKEFPAEKDHEFDAGSGIDTIILTPAVIDNLSLLCKAWGFLKYYHPAVAAGDYNWDYELFRILPGFLVEMEPAERNNLLSHWISGLEGIGEQKCREKKSKDKIMMHPDLSWIDPSNLGEELASRLTAIKCARRGEKSYYVSMVTGVGNAEFKNESLYEHMKYPDAGIRLLGLFRYWNAIQYFFPYKYLIEEDWKAVLPEFIPVFISAQDELEYRLAVLSLIARVHDTHANIWGMDRILDSCRGLNYAPLKVTFVEGKAVVTDYYDDVFGEMTGLQVGDVIETINHKPVQELLEESLPITPASNYPTQLRDIAKSLLRSNDTALTIEFSRGAERQTSEIACYGQDVTSSFQWYDKADTCYKLIEQDIAYMYPGAMKNEYLPAIMPEVMKTKGVIIDFRCYPNDFFVFTLSEYLLPKETPFARFSSTSLETPGLFKIGAELLAGKKNKDYYKGKVVILVNEITQSSAEYHAMAFRAAPGATVIGSTTAGADGNVSFFFLPGGIRTAISGIGVYYPDGGQTQRIGIVPDIEVRPTIEGVKAGRDEGLERAIQFIREDP